MKINGEYYRRIFEEGKKRKPNKSEEELEYDKLCNIYRDKFGVSFGYNVGGYCPRTIGEAIKEVQYCIENNKMQERERQDDGKIY